MRFNPLSKECCSSARGIRRSIFIHSRKSRGEVTNFSCLCFACLRKMRFFSQAAEKVAVEGLTRACGAASYKSNKPKLINLILLANSPCSSPAKLRTASSGTTLHCHLSGLPFDCVRRQNLALPRAVHSGPVWLRKWKSLGQRHFSRLHNVIIYGCRAHTTAWHTYGIRNNMNKQAGSPNLPRQDGTYEQFRNGFPFR